MAEPLIWSEEAIQDIDAIAEYIHRDSPYHAARVTEEILETGRSIIDQPMMGRVVPELGQPQTRERFVYSYRIIYELQGEAIHVLGVIHGRRLLEHLDERFRALRYRLKKLGIE